MNGCRKKWMGSEGVIVKRMGEWIAEWDGMEHAVRMHADERMTKYQTARIMTNDKPAISFVQTPQRI